MEQLRWLFIEAFVFAFLLVYFLMPKACRLGLVDRPKGRKRHRRAVPLIGGLAIFLTYTVVLAPTGLTGGGDLLLMAGGGLLVAVGALDDYIDLPPWPRLGTQVVAGLCMTAAGVMLRDLGALTPQGAVLHLGIAALPVTVLAVLGMVNAFNMSDGVDGLSGCLSLVALAGLLAVALAAGHADTASRLIILGGAVTGFLAYNLRTPLRRSAAVFLGDAGSMFLGFVLTWFLIAMSQGEAAAMPPASALWLAALPLMDTLYSILRRLAAQRSPLQPDNQHLHHLLIDAGLSVQRTVASLTIGAAALAAIGVAGAVHGWSGFGLTSGFAAVFGLYCLAVTGLRLWLQRRARRENGDTPAPIPEPPGDSALAADSQRPNR